MSFRIDPDKPIPTNVRRLADRPPDVADLLVDGALG